MAINSIPGVGPQNSDIATAVAAPSIATITSAITTNAASAGVTLAAIGTQVSSNAPSPNAWTLVGSVAPAYSASTVTFSSLSGYKSYRLLIPYIQISGAGGGWGIRINGDTGYTYNSLGRENFGFTNLSILNSPGQDKYNFSSFNAATNGWVFGQVEIFNANISGAKYIMANTLIKDSAGNNGVYTNSTGTWNGTATITSITFGNIGGAVIGNSNTIYLYGAN